MKLYLNKIRNEKNISIRDLAEKAGVGKATVERIDSETTNPSIEVMCKLAKALDVPVHELFSCD